jgi:hypothetical protein
MEEVVSFSDIFQEADDTLRRPPSFPKDFYSDTNAQTTLLSSKLFITSLLLILSFLVWWVYDEIAKRRFKALYERNHL